MKKYKSKKKIYPFLRHPTDTGLRMPVELKKIIINTLNSKEGIEIRKYRKIEGK